MEIKDSIVKGHSIFVGGSCLAFVIVNIVQKNYPLAVFIFMIGAIVFGVAYGAKNMDNRLKGVIVTVAQFIVIVLVGLVKKEIDALFALLLASLYISSVYNNQALNIAYWIALNVVGIGATAAGYTVATGSPVINGLFGLNIGAIILMYIVKTNLGNLNSALEAKEEAEKLMDKVNDEAAKTQQMMASQQEVVNGVIKVSGNLNQYVHQMEAISHEVGNSAIEQRNALEEMSKQVDNMSEQIGTTLAVGDLAAQTTNQSMTILNNNNIEVNNMLKAMDEITDASRKIESINKTIEDIAFQTNILALNAAVEAARAGVAGKGFAVVADEVRNLATKSQEASKNTSMLIDTSIQAINNGVQIAQNVADTMKEAIMATDESNKQVEQISQMTHEQNESIGNIRNMMSQIDVLVNQNVNVSENATSVATNLASEAEVLDSIVH